MEHIVICSYLLQYVICFSCRFYNSCGTLVFPETILIFPPASFSVFPIFFHIPFVLTWCTIVYHVGLIPFAVHCGAVHSGVALHGVAWRSTARRGSPQPVDSMLILLSLRQSDGQALLRFQVTWPRVLARDRYTCLYLLSQCDAFTISSPHIGRGHFMFVNLL